VAGLYHFNPQGSYSPFVKLGWHRHSFKLSAPATVGTYDGSGNHEFYGVGLLSFAWTDVATKTDNAITFNCVFILLPLYYYIIFKKTGR
jgi:hypothetical protein